MADPRDEIAWLTAQVAALTTRVYQLEQKSGVVSGEPPQRIPEVPHPAPAAPPAGTMLEPPPAYPASSPVSAAPPRPPLTGPQPVLWPASAQGDPDLEKKIGQYWLNRVGIVAILIGVSYFLKFAFENNWIGPAGRIVIGLLAGIGLVIWSERFRARHYAAFS